MVTNPAPAPGARLRAASSTVLALTGASPKDQLALGVVALVVGVALVVATGGRLGRRRPLEGRITGL